MPAMAGKFDEIREPVCGVCVGLCRRRGERKIGPPKLRADIGMAGLGEDFQHVFVAPQAGGKSAGSAESHAFSAKYLLDIGLGSNNFFTGHVQRSPRPTDRMIHQYLVRPGMAGDFKQRMIQQLAIFLRGRFQCAAHDEKCRRHLMLVVQFDDSFARLKTGRNLLAKLGGHGHLGVIRCDVMCHAIFSRRLSVARQGPVQ